MTAAIEGSDNVMFAARAGLRLGRPGRRQRWITGSTNVLMAVDEMYSGNSRSVPQGYEIEKLADVSNLGIAANDQCSLFALGTVDETVFPFCGDMVCDGAETASNCATDCAPGSVDGAPASDGGSVGPRAAPMEGAPYRRTTAAPAPRPEDPRRAAAAPARRPVPEGGAGGGGAVLAGAVAVWLGRSRRRRRPSD